MLPLLASTIFACAQWLERENVKTLKKSSLVDGTTFYLARTNDEAAQQERRRLGSHVWRMSTGPRPVCPGPPPKPKQLHNRHDGAICRARCGAIWKSPRMW